MVGWRGSKITVTKPREFLSDARLVCRHRHFTIVTAGRYIGGPTCQTRDTPLGEKLGRGDLHIWRDCPPLAEVRTCAGGGRGNVCETVSHPFLFRGHDTWIKLRWARLALGPKPPRFWISSRSVSWETKQRSREDCLRSQVRKGWDRYHGQTWITRALGP